MDKQALAIALCFLSFYCILHSPTGECTSSEEKYYTVGIDTFQIEDESRLNAVRSPGEVVAPQDNRKGDVDLILSHLNPDSGFSRRDMLLQGLERDNVLVNDMIATQGTAAFNIPVKSGKELDGPEYTVTAVIGTPARQQLLGIDTLSSLSWIQCHPCEGCSSKANFPMYVPQNSSSFRNVICKTSKCPPLGSNPNDLESKCDKWGVCIYFDINGLSQGSEGDYITDTLRLGSDTFQNFYLGCAYGFSNARRDRTSGRLGLGSGPLSLVSQKFGGQFSYCLPQYRSLSATGSLRLGKGSIPASIKFFTPMKRVANFFSSAYVVGLEDISVGGERLHVKTQVPGALPTITYIHTAVMTTRFVKPVFEALRNSFEQKMKTFAPGVRSAQPYGDFNPCYQLFSLNSVKIPTVTLHFAGNANVDVAEVGTLIQVEQNRVCFPFLPSQNDAVNIIGNVQQQGLRVAFDNANHKIGFTRESC